MISMREATGNNNRLALTNSPSGNNFRIFLNDASGSTIHSASTIGGTWSPVAGTEYEIELNWDAAAGIVRLFVDGALHGTLTTAAYTRASGNASVLAVGANTLIYNTANGSFDDVVLFNTVQHTSAYTKGYTVASTIYSGSKVDGPNFSYSGIGTVLSVDNGTISETGSPRYIVGGQYWNGSAWAISNGSYAQANDFATMIANVPSLNTGGGGVLPWSIVFTDSNTLSSVDAFSVEVTGQKYATLGTIAPTMAIPAEELINYFHTISNTVNTDLKVAIRVNDVDFYHDGSDWVESDLSIVQGNTAAEIADNLSTLVLSRNSEVKPVWILSSSANIETAEISEATIDYDFGAIAPGEPARCNVYGYIIDAEGEPVVGATVTISLSPASKELIKASERLISKTIVKTTDDNGYFDANLIRTSEYDAVSDVTYILKWEKGEETVSKVGGAVIDFTVPDLESHNITENLQGA